MNKTKTNVIVLLYYETENYTPTVVGVFNSLDNSLKVSGKYPVPVKTGYFVHATVPLNPQTIELPV
jgi:hypothetical protein